MDALARQLSRILIAALGIASFAIHLQAHPAALSPAPASPPGRDWAVDPTVAGDNVPPVGRSLFDFMVMRKTGARLSYDVPFPLSALVNKLGAGTSPGRPAHAAVLIPLGRSLQRASAAPEFFEYPRVVVAATGEPRLGQGDAGTLLKDRVYLGYQEKENLIEVISYNEAAGRFEFQIVRDYRAGAQPRVLYANRSICIACHQNAAPIFSRPVWDETNANPRIAALLRSRQRSSYGIDLTRGVDVPNAIDDATDRANLYSAHQLLWRSGCASPIGEEKSARCRAALFTAALQYRLSGRQQFDAQANSFGEHVVPVFAANARQRWPAGLRIPNPDIPNRDPFMGRLASLAPALAASHTANAVRPSFADSVDVAAAFDPLSPRPPLETWEVADPTTLARLVIGLSGFLAEADVRRLDARLYQAVRPAQRVRYLGRCDLRRSHASRRTYRIDFACKAESADSAPGVTLHGRFYGEGARVTRGRLERVKLIDGMHPAAELTDIDITSGSVVQSGARASATLRLARDGGHARSGRGHAIETMELAWSEAGSTREERTASGEAVLTVVNDFAPVHAAIEQMLSGPASNQHDAFADKPFRRASLMPALFQRLGMPYSRWCCLNDAGMPPPVVENIPSVTTANAQPDASAMGLQPFFRYCATCHQSNERSPPNFLRGSAPEVSAKLSHCAQRLYVRLAMNRTAPAARSKTAMPPDYALYGMHSSPDAWRGSAELAALISYVERALQVENGKLPRPEELLSRGYENLRPCLP